MMDQRWTYSLFSIESDDGSKMIFSKTEMPNYSDKSENANYICSHKKVNTSQKTNYDMKIVTNFMHAHDDFRPIEKILFIIYTNYYANWLLLWRKSIVLIMNQGVSGQ